MIKFLEQISVTFATLNQYSIACFPSNFHIDYKINKFP